MVEPRLEKQASGASGWDEDEDDDGWGDEEDSEMHGEPDAIQFDDEPIAVVNEKGYRVVRSAQVS